MTTAGPSAGPELLRLRLAEGAPLPADESVPARLRRAVDLARRLGAPLAPVLDAARDAADDAARAARAIEVAGAQTRVVLAGLLGAPVLLVPLLGSLAGADVVDFYTRPVGLVVLLAAGGWGGTGALLAWSLTRGASRPTRHWWRPRELAPDDVEEAVELLAVALSAGLSTAASLRAVAEQLPQAAPPLRRVAIQLELGVPGAVPAGLDRVLALLAHGQRSGSALVPSLRHLARELRADALAQRLAAAERLPALLTFPTALFLLPATVVLIGAPILDTGLQGFGT